MKGVVHAPWARFRARHASPPSVGINIGAGTVEVAAVRDDVRTASVVAHRGRPLQVLQGFPGQAGFHDAEGPRGFRAPGPCV